MMVSVTGAIFEFGLPKLMGNREGLGEPTGWAGRARRAYINMFEGLVLFAALVLVAVVAQRTNATTALGAQLFFWARLAHAVIYLAGIPWLRSAVWGVSVVGLILIFTQLI
jgi:uncharacterized MAPEG superfamily protein